MKPRVLALDIGGANLKGSHSAGPVASAPFAVWRDPGGLRAAVAMFLRDFPPFDRLALTMTAELCDAFETKREGVLRVLAAAAGAAAEEAPGAAIRVLRTDGRLASLEEARADPLSAAAANWLALAIASAPLLERGIGLVADAGSTTTDLIPILDGAPAAGGKTDTERLLLGELVYSGVRRTPVAAAVRSLPYRGRECPVAAELFATMLDAYLITGDLPEESGAGTAHPATADGRRATRRFARDRLARAICADRESFDEADALAAARFLAAAQEEQARAALIRIADRLGGPPRSAVIAGEGEFLLDRALRSSWPGIEILSYAERFGPEASRAAPAHSLMRLDRENAP